MELSLIVWIFSMIIGCLIGTSKDQVASGLIWSFLFGPFGVLVVLCLPNRKKQKEEAQRNKLLERQVSLQQEQIRYLEKMQQPVPPPPGHEPKLRIATGGEDLGEMPISTVQLLLKNGRLTQQDHYFDQASNTWMPLDCCPDL